CARHGKDWDLDYW
nr:immunoglobulin heavy chain junction region [Mus musculus]